MRNEMKQLALKLDCYVLGASAFGVFIRWLQLQIAFDDNGLCGSSSLNVAVVLIVLAAAAVFYRFIKRMKAQQFVPPAAPHEALANTGRLFSILRWVIGGMMCLGALVLAMSCETDEEVVFLLILAGLALLSGVAFPALMKKVSDPQAKISLLCLLSIFAGADVRALARCLLQGQRYQQRRLGLRCGDHRGLGRNDRLLL